jgi:glycosyltransferase involved in cell wall biosynthesis
MLEAMATGCLVIGSNTAPVQEIIREGKNGLLADFFSPQTIAERIDEVFAHPKLMKHIRLQARETILKHYDLAHLLPRQLTWLGKDGRSLRLAS